jgi:hypothetical protein
MIGWGKPEYWERNLPQYHLSVTTNPTLTTLRLEPDLRVEKPATLRVRHNLSRQPYGRKVLRVQRDLGYGEFGSHCMLRREFSNFLMMT